MTLQQLNQVITIAQEGSMNEAAKKLFVSQPNLSATVREVEEEAGITIFLRNNRGITVTAEGEEFLGYAKQVVEQYHLLENRYLNAEVKQKFSKTIDEDTLEKIIDYIKEAGYLNDKDYIDRTVNEIMALKNLSIFELKNKLYTKGISRNNIEDYVYEHRDELEEYERNSRENIIAKKSSSMTEQEIENYLYKKGFHKD